MMRVGIVGARRVRQGLGPFVAREFVAAGAEVVAVLGTTDATAREGATQVREASGADPAAFADADAFFGHELDAVCVLSPAGTHLAWVERALAAHCHVFCEKPFAWDPERDWVARAAELERAFAAAKLVLHTNTQWPFTLDAFVELTGQDPAGAAKLAMGQAPMSVGRTMIGDSLPHPLSIAQALHPTLARAEDVRIHRSEAATLHVAARLVGENATLDLEVELRGDAREIPRRAWLEIDGRRAERCIRTADYALFFREGAKLVDVPDPLTGCVRSFVRAAASGALPAPGAISRRVAMLADIAAAYDSASA